MASTAESSAIPGTAELAERVLAVRRFTVALTETLETEDFVVQSMPDVSPTKWHLAHTTWFFENFILREKMPGYAVFHERFGYLFNSYYYQVGRMHRRAERGLLTRPTVRDVMAYREHVDASLLELIAQAGDDPQIHALLVLGINHEQQHQELLLTDIKHVFSCNPLLPAYRGIEKQTAASIAPLRFIDGTSGIVTIGHTGDGFAYDNEGPAHEVLLHPHAIANRPVTNTEYREFINDGGYEKSELWLSEGWATVQAQNWKQPFYWDESLLFEFTLAGPREIDPHAPVSHVSYYEADAFARWAGCRLPLETEWENWARDCALAGNFVDNNLLHPAPANDTKDKLQVFGDVWEWTMSPYMAYPGFQPSENALGEYNGKFMCNQFVLRGGSCATHSNHIRHTYRNFFYPGDRWQFSGIRLAKDLM